MQRKNNKNSEFKKRLYKFTLDLITLVEKMPKDQVSRIIANQVLRSGTSICANYIEAYAASSKKDFANFFSYSLKSANESNYWLSLIKDTNRADNQAAQKLIQELTQISKILGSSLLTLRGKKNF